MPEKGQEAYWKNKATTINKMSKGKEIVASITEQLDREVRSALQAEKDVPGMSVPRPGVFQAIQFTLWAAADSLEEGLTAGELRQLVEERNQEEARRRKRE